MKPPAGSPTAPSWSCPTKENTGIDIGGPSRSDGVAPDLLGAEARAGSAAHRTASEVRRGLSSREPGGSVRDGEGRERDHQHAASARARDPPAIRTRRRDALRAGSLRGRRRYRWGMGIDGSETRLCECRCLRTLRRDDELVRRSQHAAPSTHAGDLGIALRHRRARQTAACMRPTRTAPSTTSSFDKLPTVDDTSPIINAMKRGDYFVSSGEVLISLAYSVEGSGDQRTITARSNGPIRSTSSKSCGATARRPIGRSSPRPIWRRSAGRSSRSPSTRRARSGCGSRRGTSRPTVRSCSQSGSRRRPEPRRQEAPDEIVEIVENVEDVDRNAGHAAWSRWPPRRPRLIRCQCNSLDLQGDPGADRGDERQHAHRHVGRRQGRRAADAPRHRRAGGPIIRELAVRKKGGQWTTLAANVAPEFRVVSGMRRITQQQLRPDSIQALGGKVSDKVMEIVQEGRRRLDRSSGERGPDQSVRRRPLEVEAFWDAPLYVEGSGVRPPTHATSIPPMNGIFRSEGPAAHARRDHARQRDVIRPAPAR